MSEEKSFEEWFAEIMAKPEDLPYARYMWSEFGGFREDIYERWEQYMWLKHHGGIFTKYTGSAKSIPIDRIKTISFVIDFTDIKKAWYCNNLPRHFGISSREKTLCLNYEKTNRAIFEYIYKRLMKKGIYEEILISSCVCDYIELPIGYAVPRENIKHRVYGVRIKDKVGKYHNYRMIDFPENVAIDYHSLYPIKPVFDWDRWKGHHQMADTIPLHCGYERPLDAFMNDNYAGPEIMKIPDYSQRHNVDRVPPDQWFHRYVYPDNHVQTFSIKNFREILGIS